jgi:hypothetical protein
MKHYLGSTRFDCAPPYIYNNCDDDCDGNRDGNCGDVCDNCGNRDDRYNDHHDDSWAQRPTTQTQNLPAGETKCPIPFRMPVAVQ